MIRTTANVIKDDEENYVLPLGEEVVKHLGWKIGDVLEWVDNHDGSWTIKRKEQMKKELVLVECISTFRMRYVVEVPVGEKDWACDSVVMGEVEEMSQHHIGEDIVSHRVISDEEFIKIFDEDNDYLKNWDTELKVRCIKRYNDEDSANTFSEKAADEVFEHSEHWYDKDRNR